MRTLVPAALLACIALWGCGGPQGDPKAAEVSKKCGQAHSSLEKFWREQLHSSQIGDFTLPARGEWVSKCESSGLNADQVKCLDPMFGLTGTEVSEECKKTTEPVKAKYEELTGGFSTVAKAAVKKKLESVGIQAPPDPPADEGGGTP